MDEAQGVSRAAEILTEGEVQRLLLACSHRAPTGVRNRALVALLYCSGVRMAEALGLGVEDVELARGALRVRAGDGRERSVHLFEAAAPYVETWLAVRSGLGLGDGGPLFCTLRGAPLKDAYVRALLPRLGRKAGVAKRVHAQGLRHSFTLRLHALGLSLGAIARQLGHADPATTRRALVVHGATPSGAEAEQVDAVAWTLAPAPGAVRVDVHLRGPAPVGAPSELHTPDGLAPIVVRPVELEELAAPVRREAYAVCRPRSWSRAPGVRRMPAATPTAAPRGSPS